MSSNDGERRMVFDLRGRRKNAVRVVYAILAVLMGASLFLLGGAGGIGDLFGGGGGSATDAAKQYEQQAEKIERQLRKQPNDPELLRALTRQQVYAGNALSLQDPQTGEVQLTNESRPLLQSASESWSQYLKATDEPSSATAQLMAPALFSLAQSSVAPGEIQANLGAAAEAQAILADTRPSIGTLSTLAIYQYYAFDWAGAKKSGDRARGYATSKFERKSLENRLDEVEKNARAFQKQLTEYNKANKGRGKESLENPLGGLGGSVGQ